MDFDNTFLKICYNTGGDCMNRRKKFSWQSIIFSIAAILLVFLSIFVLLAGKSYQEQLQRSYETENQRAAQTWSAMMEARLELYSTYIEEIAKNLYNSGVQFRAGTPPMDFLNRKTCADTMNTKISGAAGLDVLFILSDDADAPIITAKGSQSNASASQKLFSIKRYLNSGNYPTQSILDKDWQLVLIENVPYFFRAINLGKYHIGALGEITNFDFTTKMHILGTHYSCALIFENAVYHIAGEDWGEDLSLDSSASPQTPWKSSFLTADFPYVNGQLLLAVQEGDTVGIYGSTLQLLLLAGLCCILLLIALVYVLYHMVSVPIKEMLAATEQVKTGNMTYKMRSDWSSREFSALASAFNAMVSGICKAQTSLRAKEKQERQDELTMLRAQIQPHFFLNAITTVSNMTYQNRNEEIRQYIAALAKFMRYMLNLQCKQIPILAELAHIDNYLKMQAIRFPNSVREDVYLDPNAEGLEIPYLLLFTVVENTFKHAMDLYSTLELHIRCETIDTADFRGWRIVVQDNGRGFSPEVLERIRSAAAPENPKEHLGLTNVRRTLGLTYGRNDLLRLSNLPEGGAKVEIWIPEIKGGAEQT